MEHFIKAYLHAGFAGVPLVLSEWGVNYDQGSSPWGLRGNWAFSLAEADMMLYALELGEKGIVDQSSKHILATDFGQGFFKWNGTQFVARPSGAWFLKFIEAARGGYSVKVNVSATMLDPKLGVSSLNAVAFRKTGEYNVLMVNKFDQNAVVKITIDSGGNNRGIRGCEVESLSLHLTDNPMYEMGSDPFSAPSSFDCQTVSVPKLSVAVIRVVVPTCADIEGNGGFFSCSAGTELVANADVASCYSGYCTASDCCVEVVPADVPSPSSPQATTAAVPSPSQQAQVDTSSPSPSHAQQVGNPSPSSPQATTAAVPSPSQQATQVNTPSASSTHGDTPSPSSSHAQQVGNPSPSSLQATVAADAPSSSSPQATTAVVQSPSSAINRRTCGNVDGRGNHFASCKVDKQLVVNPRSTTCASNICDSSECCIAKYPTCGDLDDNGLTYSSCPRGTHSLKLDARMVYCSSAVCTVDDCCDAKNKVVLVQKISFTGVRKSELDTPLRRSIIEEAIATTLEVPKHLVQIINITDTASRRLQDQWRRLLDASVSITYIVRVGDEEEDAIRLKMEKNPSSHIVNAIAIASDKSPSAISLSAQSTVTQYTFDERTTNGDASDEMATNGDDSVTAANSAEFPAMMVAAIGGGATFILALVGFILHRRKLRGRHHDAMELVEQQQTGQLLQMVDAAEKLQHQVVKVKRDNHKNNNGTTGGGRGKKKKKKIKNENEIELTPIVPKDVPKAATRNSNKKKSTHIKHRSSEGVFYYEEKKTGATSWAVPTGGDVKVVLDETLKAERATKKEKKKGKKKGRSGNISQKITIKETTTLSKTE